MSDSLTRIDISKIAGADAPTTYNEKGAGQSHVPVRFDLVDGKAMFAMAAVLHEGAEKYGADNWRGIDIGDHLNHLIMHAYAYLSGDRSDAHLSHIMCRAMFAQAVEITEAEQHQTPEQKESSQVFRDIMDDLNRTEAQRVSGHYTPGQLNENLTAPHSDNVRGIS